MTPERWQQLKQIFQSALERNPAERSAFLNQACAGDPALRSEVESLISSHDQAGDSIEAMAAEAATEMLANDHAIVGKQIGHYQVLSQIGRGGMGEVFLAQDTALGRKVALKLLRSDFTMNEERLRRFRQEAQAASALNHPNILTIHEIGHQDPLHFMATEYVEGQTLREKILGTRMALGQALDIAVQVAGALAAAHNAGIIHRDIKPENIMVRTDGYVKVLDFGLAKLTEPKAIDTVAPTLPKVETQPGVVMGTVSYMSPEQARGLAVDARSDIWSVGVMIYEMATGRQPFEGETASDVMSLILQKEPLPLAHSWPEVPGELERIVRKALRKDKEERYQTIKDLLIDLRTLRKSLELEAEMERSAPPMAVSPLTNRQSAAAATQYPSSAEYIVEGLKQHKRVAVGAFALVLTVSAAAFLYFNYLNRAQALTEKDDILLADIVNTTGDPVFDGTLKQALAVHLGQSPFLNIIPENRVRETLRRMERSPDERITPEIGREICQRESIKALLTGSIASLGSNYVITLEALNGQTGETLARQQVEAVGKEQVITKLGEAATTLREKLGESISSIQKFDTRLAEVTTSSLDALKAYSAGREQGAKGKNAEAIPFFKHAVEIDPNFALAYLGLAVAYYNEAPGLSETPEPYATKAYELRDRVTERERFRISSLYHLLVTNDLDKEIEVAELSKQTYPGELTALNVLAFAYLRLGEYEKAVEYAKEAVHINPNTAVLYSNLGWGYRAMGRYDEAKATFEQAHARNLDYFVMHLNAYLIAFAEGDHAEMQRQFDWAKGKPSETEFLELQRWTEMFAGRYRQAQETARRAADLAQSQDMKLDAARFMSTSAAWDALVGNCPQAKQNTAKALAIGAGAEPAVIAPFAPALCGEAERTRSLIDDLARRRPTSTEVNEIWGPVSRAAVEIGRGNPAEAIQLLQKAKRYETGQLAFPVIIYMRGQAYLRQGSATEAMAEFQRIIDRRSIAPAHPLYPLAYLGLARAAALAGDTAKSRKAYEGFFALWKDADPDIPILQQAKQEYDRLK